MIEAQKIQFPLKQVNVIHLKGFDFFDQMLSPTKNIRTIKLVFNSQLRD